MSLPDVSIIIPCYNQAEFLDDCLNSVINQTYNNWECVIIDDSSPDNTEAISKKWCEQNSKIKYYKKNNGGVSSARNFGIKLAKAPIILPLDADDKIGEHYIELALPYFKNQNIKVVYCYTEMFGEKQGLYPFSDYSYEQLLISCKFACSSFFYKKEWERIGGYDEKMKEGYEDWDFWINMLSNGGEVIRIDSAQFFYRIKTSSMCTEANKSYGKLTNYITQKHISQYNRYFGNTITLYKENKRLKSIEYSKEYRLGKLLLYFPRIIYRIIKNILN